VKEGDRDRSRVVLEQDRSERLMGGVSLIMSRVLVVDDDSAMRSVVSDALRHEGYDVDCVCNGLQALTAFARHPPDALVLDIAMPGMDGVTLMRTLREQTRWGTVPVVVISGQPEPQRLGRQLGASACFSKPLDLLALIGCVESMSAARTIAANA